MAIQGENIRLKISRVLWLRYNFATDSMSLSSFRFLIIFIHQSPQRGSKNNEYVGHRWAPEIASIT